MLGATAAIADIDVAAEGPGEAPGPPRRRAGATSGSCSAGFSASTLGSRISTIAYPLLALAITGSPAAAGWTGFAAVAPSILLYFPAGLLVDRLAPRRTMLVSECGRGAVLAGVVALLVLGRPLTWELAIAAAAEQSFRVFAELGERRLTSSLLRSGYEEEGLASTETWMHTAVLVGRPLGGLLFGLERVFPFLGDFLSVCVSVLTLLPIRSGRSRKGLAAGTAEGSDRWRDGPLRKDAADAWRWWRGNPFAKLAVPITAGTTFIGQALIMVFLIDAQSQHESSLEIGLALGASGIGGAVGSAAASWYFDKFEYALLHRQLWVWTAALAVLWLAGGQFLTYMATIMAALGFTGALGNIAVDTYLVRFSGREMFARLVSIDRITSLIALALGPLAGGIAVQHYGVHDTIALLYFVALGLAVLAYFEPTMRTSNKTPLLKRADQTAPPAGIPIALVVGPTIAALALSLRLSKRSARLGDDGVELG